MNDKTFAIHPGAFTALAMLLALSAGGAQAATSYSCKPLMDSSPEPVASQTHVFAINNRQQAVGFALAPLNGQDRFAAAQWGRDRQAVRLNDNDGDFAVHSDAWDINDSGQVVGQLYDRFMVSHAVTWINGELTKLPNLHGQTGGSAAMAINGRGKIAGRSEKKLLSGVTVDRATVWYQGRATDLGALDESGNSVAYGINDDGVVVGDSFLAGQHGTLPARWVGRNISALPVPKGAAGSALDINKAGTIVGIVRPDGDVNWHAFAWQGDQGVEMGSPADAVSTMANEINAAGAVVGMGKSKDDELTALLWPAIDADPVDLNTLVDKAGCVDAFGQPRRLSNASSINDKGVIVADANADVQGNPRTFSFRLTPR